MLLPLQSTVRSNIALAHCLLKVNNLYLIVYVNELKYHGFRKKKELKYHGCKPLISAFQELPAAGVLT